MGKPVIGGQAVIEGVMMCGPGKIATAVRLPNGTIKIKSTKYDALNQRYKFLGLPMLRGVVSLGEMLVIGMQTLTWSANAQQKKEEKLTKGDDATKHRESQKFVARDCRCAIPSLHPF